MTHTKKDQIKVYKDIRWDIDGSKLSSVIKVLSDYKERFGDCFINVTTYDDYGSASVDIDLILYREETDEEYQARIKREEKQAEERKAYELKMLEELQKKYKSP